MKERINPKYIANVVLSNASKHDNGPLMQPVFFQNVSFKIRSWPMSSQRTARIDVISHLMVD